MPEYGPPPGSSTYQMTWSPEGPCTAVTTALTVRDGDVPEVNAWRAFAIVVVGASASPPPASPLLDGASVALASEPPPFEELELHAPRTHAATRDPTCAPREPADHGIPRPFPLVAL